MPGLIKRFTTSENIEELVYVGPIIKDLCMVWFIVFNATFNNIYACIW